MNDGEWAYILAMLVSMSFFFGVFLSLFIRVMDVIYREILTELDV